MCICVRISTNGYGNAIIMSTYANRKNICMPYKYISSS